MYMEDGVCPISSAVPCVDDCVVNDIERNDRPAWLFSIAHAVKVFVEQVDVILWETTAHSQRSTPVLLLDLVVTWVQMKEHVIIPVLPYTATLALAKFITTEACCSGNIHNVPVYNLLQVMLCIKARVLQGCGILEHLIKMLWLKSCMKDT